MQKHSQPCWEATIEPQPRIGPNSATGPGGLSCMSAAGLKAGFGAPCRMGLCLIQAGASDVLLERAGSREREVLV